MLSELLEDKEAFIFDLDGTLLDSLDLWNEVDTSVVQAFCHEDINPQDIGIFRDNVLASSESANPYIDYIRLLKEKYHIKISLEEFMEYRRNISKLYQTTRIMPKPYAKELVQLLYSLNYQLGIASLSARNSIDIYRESNSFTKQLEFDKLFSHVLTIEDVKKRKPNPEIYLKMLERMDISNNRAVVFEDSLVGVIAARRAKITCIAIKDYGNLKDIAKITENASYFAENLQEIYDFCSKSLKKCLKP